jgi:non-ribosomal peptide synthase protein (TIGR01720 family)
LGVAGGEVAVQLVGHGRHDIVPDLDLGSTVGYFNISYPFALPLPGRRDPAVHAEAVARDLRGIPRGGFDFEALRHLHPDQRVRDRLARIAMPQVLVSFQGTPAFLSAGKDGDALADVHIEQVGKDRPADMPRACHLEIFPALRDGGLKVVWRFSDEVLTTVQVNALASAFHAALSR